ncbi:MAG: hypothetical protein V4465_01120 [Patescibacteria group bacterium]
MESFKSQENTTPEEIVPPLDHGEPSSTEERYLNYAWSTLNRPLHEEDLAGEEQWLEQLRLSSVVQQSSKMLDRIEDRLDLIRDLKTHEGASPVEEKKDFKILVPRPRPTAHRSMWEKLMGKKPPVEEVEKKEETEQDFTAEEEEVKKEIEATPEPEREKIGFGLNRIGFSIEEKKNRMLAGFFNPDNQIMLGSKDGAVYKWSAAVRDSFNKDAEAAYQKGIDAKHGKTAHISNAASLFGNVMKYGRIAMDFGGNIIGSPLRGVMAIGAAVARGGDAAFEVRTENEEVKNKTRVADLKSAEEEAYKVLDIAEAESGGRAVSAEDLKNAYRKRLPADLMQRIGKLNPAEANSFMQSILNMEVEKTLEGLNKKITKIEHDPKLTKSQKDLKTEALLSKQEKMLTELDKIVTQYGTVDELAMVARYARFAGKTAVAAATIETIGTSLYRLWDKLADVQAVAMETRADVSVDTLPHAAVVEAAPEAVHIDSTGGEVHAPLEVTSKPTYTVSDLIKEKLEKVQSLGERPTIAHTPEVSVEANAAPLSEVPPLHFDPVSNVSLEAFASLDPAHTTVMEAMNKIADAGAEGESVKAALALDGLKPTDAELGMTIQDFLRSRGAR